MATPPEEQREQTVGPCGHPHDDSMDDFLCEMPYLNISGPLNLNISGPLHQSTFKPDPALQEAPHCSKSLDPGKRAQPEHDIHRVNPFVHKLAWDDPIDKFKTAILTVILLPFRVVLILVCLVIAWALANIGLFGLSKDDLRTKPLTGWRRKSSLGP